MTSFPKARIHRFNEDISCAPPPGTYDPKLDTVVKGCPVQKGKRFPDQLCESKSLDNINKSSNTEMTFRTPQVKRKIVMLTPKVQQKTEKLLDTPGSSSSSSSISDTMFKTPGCSSISRMDYRKLQHKLTSLIDTHSAEISVKNSEIMKLQENLVEVEHREAEMKRILKEKNILESERRNEILSVKKSLDIVEDKLRKERDANIKYIDDLKSQILLLETEKEDLKGIIAEKQSVMIIMTDRCIHLENELQLIRKENEKFKQDIVPIEEKESELIKKLVVESENKIELLEQSFNNKVRILEKHFDNTQENAQAKFQTHINHITHEFNLKSQDYKNQLNTYFTKYEELRKLVDKNEKEYLEQVKEVDERCKILYRELCSIESERDELLVSDLEKKLTMIEIQEKSNCIEKDLELYKEKCKKYEITLNTMQNTINALGDRLLESENEVIRLNSVEAELKSQKRSLEDKSQLLLSNIMALRESMGKMEQEIINDVLVMKEHLAAKVENFQIESAKKVDLLNENIYNKQCAIDKLLSELDNAMVLINELKCSKINYENEISGLKNELNEKVESMDRSLKNLEEKVTVTDEEKGILEMQLLDAENKIFELKMTNEILSNRKEELEGKITELQCTLDDAKEQINSQSKFEIKISCLEAEKSSLSLQMDEARRTILDLEHARAEKNLIISQLSEQISIERAKYNDYVSETEKTFVTLKKHNEVLKINASNGIKLQAAEEKINNLEEELRTLQIKYDKRNLQELETQKLQEELEVMRLKLQVVTDDRNKLEQETAELMGHQNIHQKIKHINQLKQSKLEMKERLEQLDVENKILKKKLAEIKENTNPSLLESSPKMKKNKTKKISSPGVLKDRN